MKLQPILLLTGIAAGLMTVSCKSLDDEAEEFFGHPRPQKTQSAEDAEKEQTGDYYRQVNAHIDRRLNEFNEKEEVRLPVFSSKEAKDEFMRLSFIQSAQALDVLSIDFSCSGDTTMGFVFDRESRTFTRTVGDATEVFAFEPFTNGVKPTIPYDAHILYAFATDFDRIAESITLRCFERLENGENPAIARLANAANLDEKGRKIDENFVEYTTKIITEPQEYLVDKRWCQCYDVKLKSICEPAVSMSIFVSNEEKTISRLDIVFDDDTKTSFIMDWREQDGIVLPRVIRRLGDNFVLFREDANVIRKGVRALNEAVAAAEAIDAEAEQNEEAAQDASEGEEETVEIDVSGNADPSDEDSAADEDILDDEDAEEDLFEEE